MSLKKCVVKSTPPYDVWYDDSFSCTTLLKLLNKLSRHQEHIDSEKRFDIIKNVKSCSVIIFVEIAQRKSDKIY
jgi:hypothetical protein